MLLVLENICLFQLHGFACNAKCFAIVIFVVFSLLHCFLLAAVFGRTAKNIFPIFSLFVTFGAWVQDHNCFFTHSKKGLCKNFSISYCSRRLQHMVNLFTIACIYSIGKIIKNSQIFGNSLHKKMAKDSMVKKEKEKSLSYVCKSDKKVKKNCSRKTNC